MYFKSSHKILVFFLWIPLTVKWWSLDIYAKLNENGLTLADILQLHKYGF